MRRPARDFPLWVPALLPASWRASLVRGQPPGCAPAGAHLWDVCPRKYLDERGASWRSVAVALPDGMLVATSDLRAPGPVSFMLLAAARSAAGRSLRTRACVFAQRPPGAEPGAGSGLDDLDAAHASRGVALICCVPIHAPGTEGGLPVTEARHTIWWRDCIQRALTVGTAPTRARRACGVRPGRARALPPLWVTSDGDASGRRQRRRLQSQDPAGTRAGWAGVVRGRRRAGAGKPRARGPGPDAGARARARPGGARGERAGRRAGGLAAALQQQRRAAAAAGRDLPRHARRHQAQRVCEVPVRPRPVPRGRCCVCGPTALPHSSRLPYNTSHPRWHSLVDAQAQHPVGVGVLAVPLLVDGSARRRIAACGTMVGLR